MKTVLIIAGESSGDIHAAGLVKEMRALNPGLKFVGLGGGRMVKEGVEIIAHIDELAFMGFVEVVRHIPRMKRLMKRLLAETVRREIELAVLVDYPGFNLRLAKGLKSLPLRQRPKVFYYISPQVWAWGAGRIPGIAGTVDRMAGILPFEAETYSNSSLDFRFVGHPLIDEMAHFDSREDFLKRHGLNDNLPLIALLPGSRRQEVTRIFPAMLGASRLIKEEIECEFAVGASNSVGESVFGNLGNAALVKNDTYNLMKHSSLIIAASGTATLEAAVAGTPLIVVYKTNPVNYLIGKRLVKLENIALVNLVAGERIAPELIQKEATPARIAEQALKILKNAELQEQIRISLSLVKDKLGEPGASRRAAALALELTQR